MACYLNKPRFQKKQLQQFLLALQKMPKSLQTLNKLVIRLYQELKMSSEIRIDFNYRCIQQRNNSNLNQQLVFRGSSRFKLSIVKI
ncbi:unnamed protein product [Paramecium sonneborni]|uniref:Uncharacterized protein n=1 Tax=Paramecium sonneborni TaxID=65129 RepID=A0A8S1RNC4_9CILI|nr:unnamed protein product [Paramecium sonneborni]